MLKLRFFGFTIFTSIWIYLIFCIYIYIIYIYIYVIKIYTQCKFIPWKSCINILASILTNLVDIRQRDTSEMREMKSFEKNEHLLRQNAYKNWLKSRKHLQNGLKYVKRLESKSQESPCHWSHTLNWH